VAAVSVLVPARDRAEHLANLVAGLGRAEGAPSFELLVGWMGGEDPRPALERAQGFGAREIEIEGDELPLARARNELANAASGSVLVFLDVDCVPSAGLLAAYAKALAEHDALAIGEARYLPRGFRADGADERSLRRAARVHPERGGLFPGPGEVRVGGEHELFWSLNFAARRETFRERIGGFDEGYRGYGIEDTDFAMRAARAAVPLAWVGGAPAFHQHHPPTRLRPEGVPALVENVRRYRESWGEWPAKGWLEELAAAGMIDWDEAAGTLSPRTSRASAIR
jgi:GT2 family glycosyltransferase